jgi:hypothetical protein
MGLQLDGSATPAELALDPIFADPVREPDHLAT